MFKITSVYVTHANAVTPFGNRLHDLWQGLLSGKTQIRRITRFPVDRYYAKMPLIEGLEQLGNRSLVYELIDRVLENTSEVPPDTF